MLIGYARVSTDDQNLDLQNEALSAVGCERVYRDKASAAKTDPAGLERALEDLRPGDTLVVWRLDRLGRSLKDLVGRAEALEKRGAGLKSIKESIDTNSRGGKWVFHLFGALAEFEKDLVRERSRAGLDAARARGRLGGRRKALDLDQRRHVVALYRAREHTVKEICQLTGISKPTLYAYVEELSDGP